ncbi:hypothetical protein PIB30_065485 [Stylosanthes scabra]|uniref:Uncharacterized protein n=1 Tax=Stylosanthes scabra TaxID=79078 RepID=A0ABU6SMY5_9FABA|nr:hypothetical protein [Stylosanthes scabra]
MKGLIRTHYNTRTPKIMRCVIRKSGMTECVLPGASQQDAAPSVETWYLSVGAWYPGQVSVTRRLQRGASVGAWCLGQANASGLEQPGAPSVATCAQVWVAAYDKLGMPSPCVGSSV